MKISRDGLGNYVAGVGFGTVSINGVGVLDGSGSANFLADNDLICQEFASLVSINLTSRIKSTVDPNGANSLVAGAGKWAAFLDNVPGVPRYRGNFGPLTSLVYDIGSNGSVAQKRDDAGGLLLDGVLLTDAPVSDVQVLGLGQALWREGNSQKAFGLPVPTIYAVAGEWSGLRGVLVGGTLWVGYFVFARGAMILHPYNESNGYIVGAGGFGQDIALLANGFIRCGWSTGQGEQPTDLRIVDQDLTLARTDLTVTFQPLSRVCHRGYFYRLTDRPGYGGDNLTAPCSYDMIEEPGPIARATKPFWSAQSVIEEYGEALVFANPLFLGVNVGGAAGDIDAIDTQIVWAHERGKRIISYCDVRRYPRVPVGLRAGDVVLMQCYCGIAESVDAFLADVTAAANEMSPLLPPGVSLGAVWQAYDRNFQETDLAKLEAISYALFTYFEATQINTVAWFSDARPGGTRDHEAQMRPAHIRFDQNAPGVPTYDQGGGTGGRESGDLFILGRQVINLGNQYFGIGTTAFALHLLWMTDRPGATAFIQWAISRGLRWFRVLGMFANPGGIPTEIGPNGSPLGPFIPADHADYFTSLASLADYLASQGVRLLYAIFADAQFAPLNAIDQQSHLDQVAAVLAHRWNCTGDLVNEGPFNGVDAYAFAKPSGTGILWSRGSTGTDTQPYSPTWDLAQFEPTRADDFERHAKDVRDQYTGDNSPGPGTPPVVFSCPVFVGEMIGVGNNFESGRTSNNPFKLWQFTLGCKMFGAPLVIAHLRVGIPCRVPIGGSVEEQCIDAMVNASLLPFGRNFEGEFHRGNSPWQDSDPNLPIVHHDIEEQTGPDGTVYPGDPNGSLRTHSMLLGARSEVIAPGPGTNYQLIADHGYSLTTILKLSGYPANAAVCTGGGSVPEGHTSLWRRV